MSGYGNMSPRTVIGRLFTMIYLIIGLPLTLILLSDLGSIITRLIKFTSTFIHTLYHDGYYDNIKSGLARRRRALIDKLKSPNKSRQHHHHHRKRRQSSSENASGSDDDEDRDDDGSDQSDDDEDERKKLSFWRSLLELGK